MDGGWSEVLPMWRELLEVRRRSPETVRTRMSWLRQYAADRPLHSTRGDVEAWLGGHGRWRPATAKSALQSLRCFYRDAAGEGWVQVDATVGVPPVRVPAAAPRPCPEATYRAALAGADVPADRMMLLLAGSAGLRRREIAGLRRDHLDGDGILWVEGKGGVRRAVPLSGELLRLVAGAPAGWLFPGRWSGHMHPDALGKRMRRLLHGRSSAHELRHRFATRAYGADRDVRAVQALLGHTSLETTQRYLAVTMDARRRAVRAAA